MIIEKPIRRIDKMLAKFKRVLRPAIRAQLRNAPKHEIEAYYFRCCAALKVAP
jgi:hypothetical protein